MNDPLAIAPSARPIARLLSGRALEGEKSVAATLRLLLAERLLDGLEDPAAHHEALIEIATVDLSLARLAEGHTDAHAIARELGHSLRAGAYGVWAAEPPGKSLRAERTTAGWRLSGTKLYASGARVIDRALVTAGPLLFDVDARDARLTPSEGTWRAVGMADSGSLDVVFDGATGEPAGGENAYVARPGFAVGGIRVAAVWLGGAIGCARAFAQRLRNKPAVDAHEAASLGRVTSVCGAMRESLAASVGASDPVLAGLHVRRVVEAGVEEVLRECGRAGGSSLMVFDRAQARRVADLGVYVRQHHGSRDDERLGRLYLESSCSS